MRLTIIGDGPVARACAAIAASRGHDVAQWSRSFTATRDVTLAAQGALAGAFPLRQCATAAQAVAGAEAVAIITAANGHRSVMQAVAPHLAPGVPVLVAPAMSLSPLVLEKLTAGRNPVGALGTTPATARPDGAGVRVLTIRDRVGIAGCRDVAETLWGAHYDDAPDLIAAALSNINPIAHLAIALCNVTRIEHREAWPQYLNMTPAVCRLIEGLDRERLALAAAYGTSVPTAEAHFARSYATTAPNLAGIAAEIHARRGGPPGPTEMSTRFVTEDVPFGLVFYQWLARAKGLAMPLTDASVVLASSVWGMDFARQNDLLALLDPPG
jgi:opine dehydrogenase